MWLDLDRWPRRPHHAFYRGFELPFFNLCAPIDLTALRGWCREHDASVFLATWFAVLRAANEVEPLRMRLRGHRVWVHERIGVGSTVLAPDETFRFAWLEPAERFADFVPPAEARIAEATAGPPRLEAREDRDDLLYGTVIPWVAFTSIQHARRLDPDDSVPRLALGRFEEREGRVRCPLSVEVHHALVDGLHVGRFFESLQALLDAPDALLG